MTPEISDDPQWYKDAVVYEVHVRAFQDSNGDGIGDFPGLTSRLDYLQELGVTALWLLPFYPSPLRDDGYDTADYLSVHPDYGTLRQFKAFLREAHRRGLRVITELVLNHTSDQHPWFQRARRAPAGSPERDWYVWSDTAEEFADARIIFSDYETSNWTWDPVAGSHFWHRFYSHQPDLNFDNPVVQDTMLAVVDFWLELGVDGLRLDAVPYLFEREGTSCENLPETHGFLRRLRRHVDERFPGRMLLAEANQWPEDAAAYFGQGDECHMAFHFPVMPRLFMALQMEDRFPVLEILEQTPAIPESAQWATFLRNHDELTLEMVTDEERDYMWRTYARSPEARINVGIRRRLAPLLGNDRRRIDLMNGLLLSLPGTPVVYYGDEIGMGDNIFLGDRDGVRTPMQWSADRNAGFSTANPQSLDLPVNIDPVYHYEKVNVADQQHDTSSLLRTTRQLLTLRSRLPVFGRGDLRFLPSDNGAVLSYVRTLDDEVVLVVANLSRAAQYAELDLTEFLGRTPVELFGRRAFPPIGDLPYLLTLAPYGFYWFALERRRTEAPVMGQPDGADPPQVTISGGWDEVLQGRNRAAVASALKGYLVEKRWFAGKAREVLNVSIQDAVPLVRSNGSGRVPAWLALVRVEFNQGEPSTWSVPLALAAGERAEHLVDELRHGVVATVRRRPGDEVRVLHEALWEPAVSADLLSRAASKRATKGSRGELRGAPTPDLREVVRAGVPEARLMGADQSNTSLVYEDGAVLKLFRRLDEGVNPDLEIGRHLLGHPDVPVPRLLGALEYAEGRQEPMTIGIVQEFVRHEADGWTHVLNGLRRFYEELPDEPPPREGADSVYALARRTTAVPDAVAERMTDELLLAELIGSRTATLHRALAEDDGDPAFTPQPVNGLYQRSLYQSMRSMGRRGVQRLRRQRPKLSGRSAELADVVLGAETELLDRFEAVRQTPLGGRRIRIHGDFHLGQLLFTGRDVVILDFEGEPLRSIGERRLPRSPLQDVAGMLRSLHYATLVALDQEVERAALVESPERMAVAEAWARSWYRWTASRFLAHYLAEASDLLPPVPEAQQVLLEGLVLEKAMYEVVYELEARPDWVWIPLRGLVELLGPS